MQHSALSAQLRKAIISGFMPGAGIRRDSILQCSTNWLLTIIIRKKGNLYSLPSSARAWTVRPALCQNYPFCSLPPHPPKLPRFPPSSLYRPEDAPHPVSRKMIYRVGSSLTRRSPHLAPHAGDRIHFCRDFVVHVGRGRHTMRTGFAYVEPGNFSGAGERPSVLAAPRNNFGRIGHLGGAQWVRMGYAQDTDSYYGRSADEFLSCIHHPNTPNASATAALAAIGRISQYLRIRLQGTVFTKSGTFWGLSGLEYPELTTISISPMPLGGRISVASSSSRRPECQRDTQIPKPTPFVLTIIAIKNTKKSSRRAGDPASILRMLDTSSGQSIFTPHNLQAHCICHAKPPRSATSSSQLYEGQNITQAMSTLAASAQKREVMPLIKPLAGSISIVISRSRHRRGCKTTDHSRARHPNWDISTFRHSTCDRSKINFARGAIFVAHSIYFGTAYHPRDGISPRRPPEVWRGQWARPFHHPSFWFPTSPVLTPGTKIEYTHTYVTVPSILSLVVVAFPETPPRRRPSPSGIDPEV
ncbi:hypothetical protein DFP72DRAFT_844490 [Ephemerocybe angulata]|uniref:Uncharacterized protein n=1 Tax=Ephemerocybe angulata TaxID=980116 RepID=A0A8H6I5C7_9AGAR|nr:hypothetical protein DFP72DRAFT_844490 [Tulosesus angulatus]